MEKIFTQNEIEEAIKIAMTAKSNHLNVSLENFNEWDERVELVFGWQNRNERNVFYVGILEAENSKYNGFNWEYEASELTEEKVKEIAKDISEFEYWGEEYKHIANMYYPEDIMPAFNSGELDKEEAIDAVLDEVATILGEWFEEDWGKEEWYGTVVPILREYFEVVNNEFGETLPSWILNDITEIQNRWKEE